MIYSQVSEYFLKVSFVANLTVGAEELSRPRVKTDFMVPRIDEELLFLS
jgi:hypothetical protein